MSEYTQSGVPQALIDICSPPANNYTDQQLMALMPRGIASDTLVPDASTGRIPVAQLNSRVQALVSSGIIKNRPQVKVGTGLETDMNKLVPQDAEMFKNFRSEYCYYEQRYRYALKKFLSLATSRNASDDNKAQNMLEMTKKLNLRTNSVLEIMNYLAQRRVSEVNDNKANIDKFNKSINEKLTKLNQQYGFLTKENTIVNTQRASVVYTEEKNNYTTNQISVWAALNVVALATIFYVYRS
jgi:hypothetical protein